MGLTITQPQLAELLGKSLKTFQNNKSKFFELGMPHPLDLPGTPIWLLADITGWLAGRRPAAPQNRAQIASPLVAEATPLHTPAKRGRGRPRKLEAVGG